jgi:hypothetical protein
MGEVRDIRYGWVCQLTSKPRAARRDHVTCLSDGGVKERIAATVHDEWGGLA